MDKYDNERLSAATLGAGTVRRHASRQSLSVRRSNINLRHHPNGGGSLSISSSGLGPSVSLNDDEPRHGFSLAHELAAALMPEPSAGSKLLADEFGLEFDEGAEGIDQEPQDIEIVVRHGDDTTEDELSVHDGGLDPDIQFGDAQAAVGNGYDDDEQLQLEEPEEQPVDPLELLSQNLEATDVFLSSLRQLDSNPSPQAAAILSSYPGSTHEPPLERVASHIIRRINDIEREREGQVRELRGVERELKRIAGEVGGNDILGSLDELECVEGLLDEPRVLEPAANGGEDHPETPLASPSKVSWLDADKSLTDMVEEAENGEADEDEDVYGAPGRTHSRRKSKQDLPPTPPSDPPTLTNTLSNLVHARMLTQSLVTSLITISEHAQVNGAATADAGRKLRALKNKIGGWRADWESAERSREKIERWEAGGDWDDETPNLSETSSAASSPTGTPLAGSRRIDGRRMVERELSEFAIVLAGVGTKAKAIMAS